jgi:hypothetical protein
MPPRPSRGHPRAQPVRPHSQPPRESTGPPRPAPTCTTPGRALAAGPRRRAGAAPAHPPPTGALSQRAAAPRRRRGRVQPRELTPHARVHLPAQCTAPRLGGGPLGLRCNAPLQMDRGKLGWAGTTAAAACGTRAWAAGQAGQDGRARGAGSWAPPRARVRGPACASAPAPVERDARGASQGGTGGAGGAEKLPRGQGRRFAAAPWGPKARRAARAAHSPQLRRTQ